MTARHDLMDGDLLRRLRSALDGVDVVHTVAAHNPNWIDRVEPEGVWLETEASRRKGYEAQLVPAWMLNAAWRQLTRTGSLTNEALLADQGLNVKRSSAVCALLARLDDVEVISARPIELRFRRRSG